MKILYIPQRGNKHPWMSDFIEAVGDRATVVIYDHTRPAAEQFEGIDYVVELGGKLATHEMIDAAAAAGISFWQIQGTGMDHVDIPYFEKKGVRIANTPGQFSSIALAEHAIYFMLCLTKNLSATPKCFASRRFYQPLSLELDGLTLGLVGLGASGKDLAKRAWGLGMKLMAIDAAEIPPATLDELHVDFFGGPRELDRLLAASDVVSIHVPLLPSTRHLIDKRALSLMKPTAYLINVARGPIVDEDALVEALRRGTIAGAGIDVFAEEPIDPAHPLLHMDNVMATQHIAGSSNGTSKRRARAGADNVFRVAAGLPPLYPVTSDMGA